MVWDAEMEWVYENDHWIRKPYVRRRPRNPPPAPSFYRCQILLKSYVGCIRNSRLVKPLLTLLTSPDGQLMWSRQHPQSIAHSLNRYFVRQKHRTCCGLTSAAIAINALTDTGTGTGSGTDSGAGGRVAVTEETVFQYLTPSSSHVTGNDKSIGPELSLGLVQRCGLSLAQLVSVIDSFPGVESVRAANNSNRGSSGSGGGVHYTGSSSLQHFTDTLIRAYPPPSPPSDSNSQPASKSHSEFESESESSVVIINYDMSKLGQPYAGHISPIAGYDAATNQCLILDVCWNSPGPVWCDVSAVWNAMCTAPNEHWKSVGRTGDDPNETVRERGFVIVRRRPISFLRGNQDSIDTVIAVCCDYGLSEALARLTLAYLFGE